MIPPNPARHPALRFPFDRFRRIGSSFCAPPAPSSGRVGALILGGIVHSVKTFATVLTAFGITFAGLQWWQIIYRVQLFYS